MHLMCTNAVLAAANLLTPRRVSLCPPANNTVLRVNLIVACRNIDCDDREQPRDAS